MPSRLLPDYLPADWPLNTPFPTEEEWRLALAESASADAYLKAANEGGPRPPRSLVDELIGADPAVPFAPVPERAEDSFTNKLNSR